MKYVVIESFGQIGVLGGINGPIKSPIKLTDDQIYELIKTQKKVFEVKSPRELEPKIELTLFNYRKNNFVDIAPVSIKLDDDTKSNKEPKLSINTVKELETVSEVEPEVEPVVADKESVNDNVREPETVPEVKAEVEPVVVDEESVADNVKEPETVPEVEPEVEPVVTDEESVADSVKEPETVSEVKAEVKTDNSKVRIENKKTEQSKVVEKTVVSRPKPKQYSNSTKKNNYTKK